MAAVTATALAACTTRTAATVITTLDIMDRGMAMTPDFISATSEAVMGIAVVTAAAIMAATMAVEVAVPIVAAPVLAVPMVAAGITANS